MSLTFRSVLLVGVLGLLSAGASLAQCPGGYGNPGDRGGAGGPSGPSGPSGPTTPGPGGPTSPTTPGPSAPVDGPDAPATGGPPRAGAPGGRTGGGVPRGAAPGAPSGGSGGRRGPAMVFTHGETTKKMLQIAWDYPTYTAPDAPATQPGATAAPVVRKALPREEAFAKVAGADRRPLLVLRECLHCQGSDVALLSREFANERTILLTNWFHCVKLPQNVSQADHPFHNLFPVHSHLFLALADGSQRIDFDGKQTQKQLWKVMSEMLTASYVGNPEESVKEMIKLLAQFDILDEKDARLQKELDDELEKKGAKSPRIARLQAELKALAVEKTQLMAKERELRKIDLKPVAAK